MSIQRITPAYARMQGREAAYERRDVTDNPYSADRSPALRASWRDGWIAAANEHADYLESQRDFAGWFLYEDDSAWIASVRAMPEQEEGKSCRMVNGWQFNSGDGWRWRYVYRINAILFFLVIVILVAFLLLPWINS